MDRLLHWWMDGWIKEWMDGWNFKYYMWWRLVAIKAALILKVISASSTFALPQLNMTWMDGWIDRWLKLEICHETNLWERSLLGARLDLEGEAVSNYNIQIWATHQPASSTRLHFISPLLLCRSEERVCLATGLLRLACYNILATQDGPSSSSPLKLSSM